MLTQCDVHSQVCVTVIAYFYAEKSEVQIGEMSCWSFIDTECIILNVSLSYFAEINF